MPSTSTTKGSRKNTSVTLSEKNKVHIAQLLWEYREVLLNAARHPTMLRADLDIERQNLREAATATREAMQALGYSGVAEVIEKVVIDRKLSITTSLVCGLFEKA